MFQVILARDRFFFETYYILIDGWSFCSGWHDFRRAKPGVPDEFRLPSLDTKDS